ncbi:MAG TPA: hypothetical protein VEJ63_16140 [Planctomycetota bacterium]|nr:hypothetical protein [Planctomycetota bacterium]
MSIPFNIEIRPPRWSLVTGGALIAILTALNVYRAATQSITHDEALTYTWNFVGELDTVLFPTANNHILHTLLARLSLRVAGHSELALRLPAVAGGLLCMTAVYAIGALACRSGWSFLLLLGLATLNPQFLDYCCAARGYGLATGFMLWSIAGILLALRFEKNSNVRHIWLAVSLCLGLSLASNLSLLLVNVAIAVLFCVLVLVRSEEARWRKVPLLFTHFALPGPFVAAALWWPILLKLGKEHFYVGWKTWTEGAIDYISAALFHQHAGVCSIPAHLLTPLQILGEHSTEATTVSILARFVAPITVAALGLTALVLLARLFWKREQPVSQGSTALLLSAGSLSAALIGFVVLHRSHGMLFPPERAAVFVGPLLAIASVLAFEELTAAMPRLRWLAIPAGAVALSVLALFVANLNVNHFRTWRYDAGVRGFLSRLREFEKPGGELLIGGSWVHAPTINCYREITVYRGHRQWFRAAERYADLAGCDALFIHPDDGFSLNPAEWTHIATHEISGSQLFVRNLQPIKGEGK